MKYTTEKLELIAKKLREMPPADKKKKEHSKQESIRVLSKEISSLQKRGYTLENIAETLRSEGLDIATPTLKSYLQRAKPVSKSKAISNQSKIPKDHSDSTAPSNSQTETSRATFTPRVDSDEI